MTAIYHCSIQIISRSKGRSAVGAAAYRSGEKLINTWDGVTHDYTNKGGVVHKEIFLPSHAPPEYAERTVLWNAVEQIEKNKHAQLAREINVALPVELSRGAQIDLVRDYCKKNFVDAGMCADIAIHDNGTGNPHAHILLTMRPFKEDGSWDDKQRKVYCRDENGSRIYDPVTRQYACESIATTDWNRRGKAEVWRSSWAELCNGYLARISEDISLDHRSYARQSIQDKPTIHLGPSVTEMERRGIRTEKGDYNRRIIEENKNHRKAEKLSGRKREHYEDRHFSKLLAYDHAIEYFEEQEIPMDRWNPPKWKKAIEKAMEERLDCERVFERIQQDLRAAEVIRKSLNELNRRKRRSTDDRER
ncbi:MAG: MobA/MobL family protein [Clostridia bacterium]|nr:MobA/MobL family protein [Clostridia bacterium]